jgi:hypothetical protein
VAGGGGGRDIEGCKESGVRRRHEACSGRRGRREMRGGWENWGNMGKTSENSPLSLASRPRASDWRCHEVSTLSIGSNRALAGVGAPTHLLDSLPFCDHGCGRVFGPEPKNCAGGILGAVLGTPR